MGISQSSVASSTLTITTTGTQSPRRLAFLQQPSNATTQVAIAPAVTVAIEDAAGKIVSSSSSPVTLSLAGNSTSLGGTVNVTAHNGIATFSNLTVATAGGAYTLSATSVGLASATSASFTISAPGGIAPKATKLAFLQQPSNALTQTAISPAVTVAVEDANGNVVSSAANLVTLNLSGGAAALGGALSATPHNGIATFNNLTLATAGSGYTHSATSAGLASAISASFTITAPDGIAPTVTKLVFLQQPSNAVAQAVISPAVTVAVEDDNGNILSSAANLVTLNFSGGAAGLGGMISATPHNGIATFSNLTVATAGSAYTLSATSAGLSSAISASFTITAPGGTAPTATKLAFLQQPSNAVAQAVL